MTMKNHIKTHRILKTGDPGTKKISEIYGDKLVCVRYKNDYKRRKRYKTVELIVEEKKWKPARNDPYSTQKVYVRIRYGEAKLARSVKAAGGSWIKEKRLWRVPFQTVLDLDIEERLVNLSTYGQT